MQSQIRATLANVSYATFEIGSARQKVQCPNATCGEWFYPKGWQGNTVGVPDLLAYRNVEGFPAIAILLEVKTEDGGIRPAQKMLNEGNRSYVVRSCADALVAVRHAEATLSRYSTPLAHALRLGRFEGVSLGVGVDFSDLHSQFGLVLGVGQSYGDRLSNLFSNGFSRGLGGSCSALSRVNDAIRGIGTTMRLIESGSGVDIAAWYQTLEVGLRGILHNDKEAHQVLSDLDNLGGSTTFSPRI